MGREVRRVPTDWKHPKNERGHHIPLRETYRIRREALAQWERGLMPDYATGGWLPKDDFCLRLSAEDYFGSSDPADFMPDWPVEACTHIQMYEDTTEGTPLSPVMKEPEDLARWLADNGASSFGDSTAPYEAWLRLIKANLAGKPTFTGLIIDSGVATPAIVAESR